MVLSVLLIHFSPLQNCILEKYWTWLTKRVPLSVCTDALTMLLFWFWFVRCFFFPRVNFDDGIIGTAFNFFYTTVSSLNIVIHLGDQLFLRKVQSLHEALRMVGHRNFTNRLHVNAASNNFCYEKCSQKPLVECVIFDDSFVWKAINL